jgi:hypothetical protein
MIRQRTSPLGVGRGLAALLLVAAAPVAGSAQQLRLTVVGGVSQYDLSGTGDAFTTAVRVDAEITEHVLWEASVGFTFPSQQFGDTTTVFAPEAQVQLQWPARLAPYIGIGAGLYIDFRDEEVGGTKTDPTFAGALGLRYGVTDEIGVRAELRARGVGTNFAGSAAEWTGGLSYRF